MKNIKKKVISCIFLATFLVILPVLFFSKNILSYINTQMKQLKLRGIKNGKPLKIVVFDLDETLGYFTEISIFWDALENFYGHNLMPDKFFEMLDVFPEFFRPNIFVILAALAKKRGKNACSKLVIYTNNQGPKGWVTMISDYINEKVGQKVFDHIIAAYKIRGKQIEPKRTSHDKSVKDLISCTNIPANTEICFIDDLYHPLMDKENVYYINIKPYRVSLPFSEMASRYCDAVLGKTPHAGAIEKMDFVSKIVAAMNQYNYMVLAKSAEEEKVDAIVSKTLFANLDEFLKNERPALTRKKRTRRVKTLRHK